MKLTLDLGILLTQFMMKLIVGFSRVQSSTFLQFWHIVYAYVAGCK